MHNYKTNLFNAVSTAQCVFQKQYEILHNTLALSEQTKHYLAGSHGNFCWENGTYLFTSPLPLQSDIPFLEKEGTQERHGEKTVHITLSPHDQNVVLNSVRFIKLYFNHATESPVRLFQYSAYLKRKPKAYYKIRPLNSHSCNISRWTVQVLPTPRTDFIFSPMLSPGRDLEEGSSLCMDNCPTPPSDQ